MLNQYPNLTYVVVVAVVVVAVVVLVLVDDADEMVTFGDNWFKSLIYLFPLPCFSISYLFQVRTILISIFSVFFSVLDVFTKAIGAI